MFEKLDKSFFIVKKIILILTCLLIIGCIVGGVIIAVKESLVVSGVLLAVLGPLLCLLGWGLFSVLFGFFRDIKLIRNKLYGASSEDFMGSYL